MNIHPKYGEMKDGNKRGNGYHRSSCRNSRLKALYGIQKGYLHTTVYFSEEKQCLMEGPVLDSKVRKFAKNISNRRIRRYAKIPDYGGYKKVYRAMWWFI